MEFVIFTTSVESQRRNILSQGGQKSFLEEVGLKSDHKKDKGKEQHEQKQWSNEYGKLQYLIGRQESQLEKNGKSSWIGRMET